MFWVKTAFRVGWDTSFQPLGWATSSTTALSLWRESAKWDQKQRRSKAGIKDCRRQWSAMNKDSWDCKQFGFTGWHGPVLSLLLCQCFKDSKRREGTKAGAEVCHCWHRQGRMPGQFSSVTVTGSTSVVLAVCLEAVPGRCIWSVSWAQTGFVSAVCPMGWKSLSRTYSAALFKWQILCFESA